MAKYAHIDVLKGGGLALQSAGIKMYLLGAYTAADPYATVLGNAIASAITLASGDYTFSGADGASQVCTIASKTTTATATSSGNLHLAITDGSAKVLLVTDVTDQPVTSGNPITVPSFTFTMPQPT